ncbi:hypothetical protein DKX38_017483 [Salix brachista]|uniref:Apple domain-containing protein n=1 Tax=Salix brachista TaxID=2182728 RepID=A0A5N5KVF9_9ROSI|nr:hypothetical protein DKX38_017483 [Salix brachista]
MSGTGQDLFSDPAQVSFQAIPRLLFFLYKNLSPCWLGGPWNGHTLSGLPDVGNRLKKNDNDYSKEIDLFIYSFEYNQNESSVSFSARNGTVPSILVLEPRNGAIADLVGKGKHAHSCLDLRHCILMIGTRVYANVSLKECERECLKSCNCTGYASSNVTINGLGCIAWYDGKLADIRKFVDGHDFYLRVDAEELAQFRARTLVFIGVPVVLLVFVLALRSFYLWRRHTKKKGNFKPNPSFM